MNSSSRTKRRLLVFFIRFIRLLGGFRSAAFVAITMDRKIIPLIMCGGAGTRLWPASREVRPKQFLPLFGARSTFQDTVTRVSDASLFDRTIVITNAAYRFMVLEQLAEIGVALLLFGVGLHFSIADLVSVWRIAVPGALLQVMLSAALSVRLPPAPSG